jgi:hypothetical protein
MQGIRLLVSFALVIVPAAGILCALRTRDRRLTAVAAAVLVAGVAVAGFTMRSTHRPIAAPTGTTEPADSDSDVDSDPE